MGTIGVCRSCTLRSVGVPLLPQQKLKLRPSKLLQVQSSLHSYISPVFYSSNASSSSTMATTGPGISPVQQTEISRVVDYWFTPSPPDAPISEKWFQPRDPRAIDDEIRTNFEPLILRARNNELDDWSSTPLGSLALIILLDQYPRNIYRGSHLSYSSDDKAVQLGIAEGRGSLIILPYTLLPWAFTYQSPSPSAHINTNLGTPPVYPSTRHHGSDTITNFILLTCPSCRITD